MFQYRKPLDVIDIIELTEKVKNINIVALAQGYVLKTKVLSNPSEHNERIRDMAIQKFEEAIISMPNNSVVLSHLGDLYKNKGDHSRAADYYLQAMRVNPKDPTILYKYANFLTSCNNFEVAEKFYKEALEKVGNDLL